MKMMTTTVMTAMGPKEVKAETVEQLRVEVAKANNAYTRYWHEELGPRERKAQEALNKRNY